MNKLFTLNDMLTPRIVTVLYWLGLITVVFTTIVMLFDVGQYQFINFMQRFFLAIATLIGGGLLVRVYSELLIVIFKIHENLKKIADR